MDPDQQKGKDDPLRGAMDDALGRAIEAVPEGPFKRILKQAGFLGLFLSVLIGNVPWSIAIKETLDGKVPLDLNALKTYWSVLVLFTPFVVLSGVAVWMVSTGRLPQVSGAVYLIGAAALWFVATNISLYLGGVVPITALGGPSGGPSGALQYITDNVGYYIEFYGPLPVIAGPIEGAACGYWAALLSSTS